jgi:hypothetical protein
VAPKENAGKNLFLEFSSTIKRWATSSLKFGSRVVSRYIGPPLLISQIILSHALGNYSSSSYGLGRNKMSWEFPWLNGCRLQC